MSSSDTTHPASPAASLDTDYNPVLMEQGDNILAQLPEEIIAEARAC